ncbi:aminodeoxychorismate lyase [Streptomyces sp. SL13]|jgi:branched-chain amino acid aminotransferase|uniref:aminodeoxychorismate lyase n=1 Tax=Streptantibioticus silvisoli TaxID=2705255 RepID=A0AA90H156_9ACTN|nr:aminodeoxychorismate lyase [Streptantibioticus silvisoli]MDI5964650.1 aminodeoxychorismate lyase [Streptantibioticus silvisoli]MDI5972123.1 aminodeoxychorismate lyase [Streptantibioticus silvisoli]
MMIWVNGRLREAAEATVSALDHGLTVGDGVFETVKTVDGRPFALDRHVERLARSARGLGLPEPDAAEVRRAVAEITAGDPPPLGRLRITFTGGVSPLGSERGREGPTLLVAHDRTTRRPDSAAVVTVPWTRNENGALTGLKTTSYGENVLALAHAHARDASEALFANTRGRLCEGTGSNVFVVIDGELLTPPLDSGCLAGITRRLVLEWTGAREADLPLKALREADEVFLTSTLRDVQAVHRIDDHEPPAAPGPVTTRAMTTFAERAAAEENP